MSTKIRPEVSNKNKYWISKDRYYELKHFCLQYKEWKQALCELSSCNGIKAHDIKLVKGTNIGDPTSRIAVTIGELNEYVKLVESCANDSDIILAPYIVKAVTEGLSFTYLKSVLDIPCERDMYYDRYRRFFWLLSARR